MAIPIAVVLLGYIGLGTHAPAINRLMDYQPRWPVCLCYWTHPAAALEKTKPGLVVVK